MRKLAFILQKEFRQIFRNPSIIRVIFIMPIMQLIVLPNAADYEIKNINLHVVDHDNTSLSRRLVENIRATGYFKIEDYGSDRNAGLDAVERDKADIILEIPNSFEKTLVREEKAKLMISVNAINGVKGGLGGAYLNTMIRQFNEDIRTEWMPPAKTQQGSMIKSTSTFWFNPSMNYKFFMVPGILVLLLTMVGSNLAAINIVREKEIGTIEQINVSPVKKYQFILGKLIPFWVIGIVVMTIGFIIAWLFYGIIPLGSYLTVYVFAAVYLLVILGIGLLISNYSSTQQQAMLVSFFLMMIFVLMSGLYTSIESMPEWAKWIAHLNPVSYFIEVIRRVVLKGASLSDVNYELGIVFIYAIAVNTWAIISYRKRH